MAAQADTSGSLMGGGERRAAFSALLANRAFRNLLAASGASALGDWIGFFAILSLTNSVLGGSEAAAFGVAGVMVARVLPPLLLGTVAGVLTDRWDRKKVMIWTDIGRGFVMFGLAFSVDVFQLFVLSFVIELMSALFIPAKDATVPNIVAEEDLGTANQLSLAMTYGPLPLGSFLFAILAATAAWVSGGEGFLGERPAALAIWFNALTFFASAFFIMRVPIPPVRRRRVLPGEEKKGGLDELKEGWRFIGKHPLVRALIFGITTTMLAAGIVISTGTFLVQRLNATGEGFGILGTVVGLGLVVGMLLAERAARRVGRERIFAPGVAVAGGALMGTALMPRLDLAIITAAFMGIGAGVAFVSGYTMLHAYSYDEVRGRTFAAFNAAARLSLFAAVVIGPIIAASIGLEDVGPDGTYPYSIGGTRITLLIAGALAVAGAVWTGRTIFVVLTERSDELLAERRIPRAARRGVFIAFEGGDGAGKSTQIAMLRSAITDAGFKVQVTREPGGTDVGEEIRHILLEPGRALDHHTEAMLYAAARAQLVRDVIVPALNQGVVVLSDRFVDSSVVYQGVVRQLGADRIAELNDWATDGVVPDLVVLLDVDPEIGLARAAAAQAGEGGTGDAAPDRLEAEGLSFHRQVNAAFRDRAAAAPERYLVLDASLSAEVLAGTIRDRVLTFVEEHTSTLDMVVSTEAEAS